MLVVCSCSKKEIENTAVEQSEVVLDEQTKASEEGSKEQVLKDEKPTEKATKVDKSTQESKQGDRATGSSLSEAETKLELPATKTPASSTTTSNTETKGTTPSENAVASHSTCTFDGGKVTTVATCKSEGQKTYTCTSCSKTKTEVIAKTTHNYVEETTAPTCIEKGKIKTYCSICGDVKSEVAGAAATGHTMKESYYPAPPTCMVGSHLSIYCEICKYNEFSGSVSSLEHNFEPTEYNEKIDNSCKIAHWIILKCSGCGYEKKSSEWTEKVHEWVWDEGEEAWDPINRTFIKVPYEYCKWCNCTK